MTSHGYVELLFLFKPHLCILCPSYSTQETASRPPNSLWEMVWNCSQSDTLKNYLQSRWPFSNSGFIHSDRQALMAAKSIKWCRNAARMRESSPCLLHYPLCHILFWVSDQERGPFGHKTGRIMHPAKDGQVEQTYLLCSLIRGLVVCHSTAVLRSRSSSQVLPLHGNSQSWASWNVR